MTNLGPCPSCGNTKPCITRKTLPNGKCVCIIECMDEAPAINFSVRGVGETEKEAYEMAVLFWNIRYKLTCKSSYCKETDEWQCHECGGTLQACAMFDPDVDGFVSSPKFCPNCGAVVLDD